MKQSVSVTHSSCQAAQSPSKNLSKKGHMKKNGTTAQVQTEEDLGRLNEVQA